MNAKQRLRAAQNTDTCYPTLYILISNVEANLEGVKIILQHGDIPENEEKKRMYERELMIMGSPCAPIQRQRGPVNSSVTIRAYVPLSLRSQCHYLSVRKNSTLRSFTYGAKLVKTAANKRCQVFLLSKSTGCMDGANQCRFE